LNETSQEAGNASDAMKQIDEGRITRLIAVESNARLSIRFNDDGDSNEIDENDEHLEKQ
jgi:hypothetical protein